MEVEPTKALLRDTVAYCAAIAPTMPEHLRDALLEAMLHPSVFLRLTEIGEVLYAGRAELGDGGREILRRIALWADALGQQRMANGRGQAIAEAMLSDTAAGAVVERESDPAPDPRFIEPLVEEEPVEEEEEEQP